MLWAKKKLLRNLSLTFHAWALWLYPLIFLYERNSFEARVSDFVFTLACALLICCTLLVAGALLFRNLSRAALLASYILGVTLFYGPIAAWLLRAESPGLGLLDFSVVPAELLLFFCLLLISALVACLIKRAADGTLQQLTGVLNVFAAVVLIFPLVGLGVQSARQKMSEAPVPLSNRLTKDAPSDRPDIIYVVLDAYARADVLDKMYGYDNKQFLQSLEDLGFYIAHKARANYPVTILSLASSLNGNYLQDMLRSFDTHSKKNGPIIRSLKEAHFLHALRNWGYKIVNLSSGYYPSELDSADIVFEDKRLNNFLASASGYIQFPFLRSWISKNLQNSYALMLNFNMLQLGKVTDIPGPKFVFCHILAPHPPFIFSKQGNLTLDNKLFTLGDGDHYGSREEYRERYLAQLEYVSKTVLASIKEILRKNSKNTIIIVQGDHGPGSQTYFQEPEKTSYFERMSILSAYYFPDQNYSELYETISPVNTFRLLSRQYLGQNMPLLPDRSFFSSLEFPFRLKQLDDDLLLR